VVMANHGGELSDSELDAVLSAANEDLLAYIRSSEGKDGGLLAIMAAGDIVAAADMASPSRGRADSPAAMIAAGMRSFARAIELTDGVGAGEEPEDQLSGLLPESAGPVRSQGRPIDVEELLLRLNSSSEMAQCQWLRARHAADIADRSSKLAELAAATAQGARVTYRTVQAERPRRRASLPRQVMFLMVTVALNGLACYFAAQALSGSQVATLGWAGLFLAILTGGEVALDFYRDHHQRTWRIFAVLLGASIVTLGVLRGAHLSTVGSTGLVPAVTGACLFTVATAGSLFLGYRALRAAETPQAWRARRWARAAGRAAQAACAAADQDAAERDQLINTYLSQVRIVISNTCSAEQLAMEAAVRGHLGQTLQHKTRPSVT
jgi:hypothetical protein